MQPVSGAYLCLDIDFRLCHFDLNTTRPGTSGCVVEAPFLAPSVGTGNSPVMCKVVDILRDSNAVDSLNTEVNNYAALRDLQGKVIPKVYGFYQVWGILRFLALEPVGDAIPDDEQIDASLRTKMRAALQCIHDAGFVHGDIARRNFCRTKRGKVFLVDLETCRSVRNRSKLSEEMNAVDRL